ncbi:unnamed protein product [Arctogadus glacialis]
MLAEVDPHRFDTSATNKAIRQQQPTTTDGSDTPAPSAKDVERRRFFHRQRSLVGKASRRNAKGPCP